MAKIGLKYPIFKGTTAGVIAKAIQADISIEVNDVKLYADDIIAESDRSFKSGKITLGVDDLSDTIQNEFLGHTLGGDSEITANSNDQNPFVSIGFYGTKRVNGIIKYRAIWLPKVQFGEPNDSNKTKGETVTFETSTIEGTIMTDVNGNWKQEKTFENESDAIAYLNTKAGLPVSASTGLSALSLTGTGGTLSPAFGASVRYYTFNGVTGSSVTVTATAVNHAIQLYVDGVLNQTLTSGVASTTIPVAVGTKKLTIVAVENGKTSQTTEIIVVKTA